MKNILIVKTGAAGDVLRTTFVLETLSKEYSVYWLTHKLCVDLIDKSIAKIYTSVNELPKIYFEKVYCLEEDIKLLTEIKENIQYNHYIGYYSDQTHVKYDSDLSWFNMSLNSKYGIEEANQLKIKNRKTFQELVGKIFNVPFQNQPYNKLDYNLNEAEVKGDIAIAKNAGEKWPNKNWAYYDELKNHLENLGYVVNYLPNRLTIKEHIADIASHKFIICGDSLPMHISAALDKKCIALFTCTSPWEINDYGLIYKIVSPNLEKYYYNRDYNLDCVTSIKIQEVLNLFDKIQWND